jgi:NaMN:DMB phosphoribosyltransferase
VDSACLLVFAADHGVTLQQPSVSAYPRQASRRACSLLAALGAARTQPATCARQ